MVHPFSNVKSTQLNTTLVLRLHKSNIRAVSTNDNRILWRSIIININIPYSEKVHKWNNLRQGGKVFEGCGGAGDQCIL